MLDFAVLTEGANGNLEGATGTTGDITYTGKPGVSYYYEETRGDGITYGMAKAAPVSLSGDYRTVNFGQQPFVYEYNSSQDWASRLSGSTSIAYGTTADAFDGDLQTTVYMDGQNTEWVFDVSGLFPGESTVQVYTYSYQTIKVTDDLGTDRVIWTDDFTQVLGFVPYTPGVVQNLQTIKIYPQGSASSNSNNINAIKVGGKTLVNPGNEFALAYPNQLKQTWAEWNFGELDLCSGADRAIWRGIRTKLLAYPGQRNTFKSALIAKIATLNLTETEKALLRNRIFRQTLS